MLRLTHPDAPVRAAAARVLRAVVSPGNRAALDALALAYVRHRAAPTRAAALAMLQALAPQGCAPPPPPPPLPPPPPRTKSDTPRPSPRTNRTRRVLRPVLIGHAASLGRCARGTEEAEAEEASRRVVVRAAVRARGRGGAARRAIGAIGVLAACGLAAEAKTLSRTRPPERSVAGTCGAWAAACPISTG